MVIKYFSPAILALARKGDAGFDLTAQSEPNFGGLKGYGVMREGAAPTTNILALDYIEYDTETIWSPPEDNLVGIVVPRSSVTKYNLSLKNSIGIIDSGYRGNIKVRFQYLWQPQDLTIDDGKIVGRVDGNKIYKKSDRVAQLLVFRVLNDVTLARVGDKTLLSETVRGEGGFGSTNASL